MDSKNSSFSLNINNQSHNNLSNFLSPNKSESKTSDVALPIIGNKETAPETVTNNVLQNTISSTFEWGSWAINGLWNGLTFTTGKAVSGTGFAYTLVKTKGDLELALNFNGKEFIAKIQKEILEKCKQPQLLKLADTLYSKWNISWLPSALQQANILQALVNLASTSLSDPNVDPIVNILAKISEVVNKSVNDAKELRGIDLEKLLKEENFALKAIEEQKVIYEKSIENLKVQIKKLLEQEPGTNKVGLYYTKIASLEHLLEQIPSKRIDACLPLKKAFKEEIVQKILLLAFPRGKKDLILPEKIDFDWLRNSIWDGWSTFRWAGLENTITDYGVSFYHDMQSAFEKEAKWKQEIVQNTGFNSFENFEPVLNSFFAFVARDTSFSNDMIVRNLEINVGKDRKETSKNILSRMFDNEYSSSLSRSLQQILQSKDPNLVSARAFIVKNMNSVLLCMAAKASAVLSGKEVVDADFTKKVMAELPYVEILKNYLPIEEYLKDVQKSLIDLDKLKEKVNDDLGKLGNEGTQIKSISESCAHEWIVKNLMESIVDEARGQKNGPRIGHTLEEIMNQYCPGLGLDIPQLLSGWVKTHLLNQNENEFKKNTKWIREVVQVVISESLIKVYNSHNIPNQSFIGSLFKNGQEIFGRHFPDLNNEQRDKWKALIETRKQIQDSLKKFEKTQNEELTGGISRLIVPRETERRKYQNLIELQNVWLHGRIYEQQLEFSKNDLQEKLIQEGITNEIFAKIEEFLQFSKNRVSLKEFIVQRSSSIVTHERRVMDDGSNLSKEIEAAENDIEKLKGEKEKALIEWSELTRTYNNEHEEVKQKVTFIEKLDEKIEKLKASIELNKLQKKTLEKEQLNLNDWNRLFLNLNESQLAAIEDFLRINKTFKRAKSAAEKMKVQYDDAVQLAGLISDDAKKLIDLSKKNCDDFLDIQNKQRQLEIDLKPFKNFANEFSSLFGLQDSSEIIPNPILGLLPKQLHKQISDQIKEIKDRSLSLALLDNSAPFMLKMDYQDNKQRIITLSGNNDHLFKVCEAFADDIVVDIGTNDDRGAVLSDLIINAIPGAVGLQQVFKVKLKEFLSSPQQSDQQKWIKEILTNMLMKIILENAKDDPHYKEKILKACKDTLVGLSPNKPPLLKLFKIEKPADFEKFGLTQQMHKPVFDSLKKAIKEFRDKCGFAKAIPTGPFPENIVLEGVDKKLAESSKKLNDIFKDDRGVNTIKNLGNYLVEIAYSTFTSSAKGSNVKGANIVFEAFRSKVNEMKTSSKLGMALASWIDAKEDVFKEELSALFLQLKDREATQDVRAKLSTWFSSFMLVPIEEGISKLIKLEEIHGRNLNEELLKQTIKLVTEHLELVNRANQSTMGPVDSATFIYNALTKETLHRAIPLGTTSFDDVVLEMMTDEPFKLIWKEELLIEKLKELGEINAQEKLQGRMLTPETLKVYFHRLIDERVDLTPEQKESSKLSTDHYIDQKGDALIIKIWDASHFEGKRLNQIVIMIRDYILGSNHSNIPEYRKKERGLRKLIDKLIADDKSNFNPLTNQVLIDALVGLDIDLGPSKRQWIIDQDIRRLIREAGSIDSDREKMMLYKPHAQKILNVMFPGGKDSLDLPDEATKTMVWNLLGDNLLPLALSAMVESLIDTNTLKRMAISTIKSAAKQIGSDESFSVFTSIINAIKRFFNLTEEPELLNGFEAIIAKIHSQIAPEMTGNQLLMLDRKMRELGRVYDSRPREFKDKHVVDAIEEVLEKKLNKNEKEWIKTNRFAQMISNAYKAPPNDELHTETKKLLITLINMWGIFDPVKFLSDTVLPDLDPLNDKFTNIVNDGFRKEFKGAIIKSYISDLCEHWGANSPSNNTLLKKREAQSDEARRTSDQEETDRFNAQLFDEIYHFASESYHYTFRYIESLLKVKWDEASDFLNLPEGVKEFLEGLYQWTLGVIVEAVLSVLLFPWIWVTALINNYLAHESFGPIFQDDSSSLKNLAFKILDMFAEVLGRFDTVQPQQEETIALEEVNV